MASRSRWSGRSRVVWIWDLGFGGLDGEPRGGLGFDERAKGERLGEGGGDAGGIDFSGGGEALEDGVAADDGPLGMADGIEAGRGLGQPGEQGALGEREVGEGFLEIEPRGLGGADAEISVVEAVQVGGEDLAFRPGHFQAAGGERFADFGERTAFGGRRGNFDELLGDGGGAGNDPPFGEQIAARPQCGQQIDAAVVVKPLVLGGERAGDEVRRNFVRTRPAWSGWNPAA